MTQQNPTTPTLKKPKLSPNVVVAFIILGIFALYGIIDFTLFTLKVFGVCK